jgi:hypothetical protein
MRSIKQIRAGDLEVGLGVKAPGAPAFSIIRDVDCGYEEITASLDWGQLAFDAMELVWVLQKT